MIQIQPLTNAGNLAHCQSCGIRHLVLFANLVEKDFQALHTPIDEVQVGQGEQLFRDGDNGQAIYTLRQGMIKLVKRNPDGRDRILRLLRIGDVVGLESMVTQHYGSDAVALQPSTLCRIPLSVIQELALQNPKLHVTLMERWYQALKEADDWLAELNFGSARKRVARLILRLRDRLDPTRVTLLSREDMGSISDLTFETVSREVNRFVREGALAPSDKMGRHYSIKNEALLQEI